MICANKSMSKILRVLAVRPYFVRELTRETGCQITSVHRNLESLKKCKILTSRKKKEKLIYSFADNEIANVFRKIYLDDRSVGVV